MLKVATTKLETLSKHVVINVLPKARSLCLNSTDLVKENDCLTAKSPTGFLFSGIYDGTLLISTHYAHNNSF